jgi:hypothetical protein
MFWLAAELPPPISTAQSGQIEVAMAEIATIMRM